ncbi:DNA polymerase III subunit delta' [Alteromonas sp. C1M14]|uniref:DNA polymerase III subunit delta' n=1 Tax=Alteromonas sp. C1M14 TaxID=2841567 RepID=UPI001C088F4E|nr:DNA polymerase III subunit delta' [Alteromonas sp. C1M14]MBU2976721.1 DNA polymerase III subunit delta' [Alteromonas sp. C1M14]
MIYPWLTSPYSQFVARSIGGNLHHALLLSGPAGLGKQALAESLSHVILCRQLTVNGPCGECQSCQLLKAGSHPDFYLLTSEKQLGVDKIREGIGKLTGTAQLSNNKVLIIPHADTMTEAASNALLKTLEEPTKNTFIILTTDKKNGLLPTILSRCEKHTYGLPAPTLTLSWLQQQGYGDVTDAYAKAYGYSPLGIRDSLDEGSDEVSYQDFTQGLVELKQGKVLPGHLASKWQDSALLVVSWLQAEAHRLYIDSQSHKDYQLCLCCQKAKKHLQHAGVNKTVILSGLLDVFSVNQ